MAAGQKMFYGAKSKIPESAALVFHGVIWDVYQWNVKMFDGSDGTFEGLRMKPVVKIVAVSGDKLFITRERTPADDMRYSLFGGLMEEGEEPLDAAKRELLEEGGMEADGWEFLTSLDMSGLRRVDSITYLFLAKNCSKVADQSLDPGEELHVEEVDFDTAMQKLGSDSNMVGGATKLLFKDPTWIGALKEKVTKS